MKNTERQELEQIKIAPWIQKATRMIGLPRKIGGNQFRHQMSTLTILLDYHYTDAVLLKAALIHDLIEDFYDNVNILELENLDSDGPDVVNLVWEVTRRQQDGIKEPKETFLARIRDSGSVPAKTLKAADRIQNLTDININLSSEFIKRYLDETITYIAPMAAEVNRHMYNEITDLIKSRKLILKRYINKNC